VTEGTLSVYHNGTKAIVSIGANETFESLNAKISAKFSDVEIVFDSATGVLCRGTDNSASNEADRVLDAGCLTIRSKTGGEVKIGGSTDTSNFAGMMSMMTADEGYAQSARSVISVNANSKVTQSGLFRQGDVTTGTFMVGNATINIDSTTTIDDIVNQITNSTTSNANAYWDGLKGELMLVSRSTGSTFVNVQKGTSNFTDIMGLTSGEIMNTGTQKLGSAARVIVNGTTYTANSNTIKEDVSRLTGVTLDLHGLSEGETVKLTIEKDTETLANTISDIVDSYNELMKNLDEQISLGGQLHDETSLKLIRNRIRNLMTTSLVGASGYMNLNQVGIGIPKASGGNISTATEDITYLSFNKSQFLTAFLADQDALKNLLVGTINDPGIFLQIDNLIYDSFESQSSYFNSATKSYDAQIQKVDSKIKRANASVETYQRLLENKFRSMDMLIAEINEQYNTFLLS
jgi:flagellar capping protein FliD